MQLYLAHLSNIHAQLFADVHPVAGQLRHADIGKARPALGGRAARARVS